jgi:DNA-binding transcriptional ArsR family regulator
MKRDQLSKGSFAFEGLDRVMHERARLGILSCLAAVESALTFADLKELCGLTDGNLSRHLSALEQAELIELQRGTRRGRPLTLVRFTRDGRKRFLDYVEVLESIVRTSTEIRRQDRRGETEHLPDGWVPAR